MGWTQERAAEELGVSCPTYKRMELKREGRMPAPVPRAVEYATTTLTLKAALPDLHRMNKTQMLMQLQHILNGGRQSARCR
ncbi:XRE family transcriptional regulator [Pantoea agglomerans]|uniref:XRE family transcriptional regulator n=1 Tax=Enterobacter agglomerans TaxID=549 RepID=UPI001F5B1642|nr:XRE family transcriptional regulator [Pantoea agglomerans]